MGDAIGMVTVSELTELAEWDWMLTEVGTVLHHLARFDDPGQAEVNWGGPGRTTCGLQTKWLSIPGLLTRMEAKRCERCCRAVGYPLGYGSPKNDDALRPLVEARLKEAGWQKV